MLYIVIIYRAGVGWITIDWPSATKGVPPSSLEKPIV